MGLQGGGRLGGYRQHFSSPLPSQLRGIVVESAAALFHSALQTLGSEYCVARWGTPAERGGQRQRQRHNEVMAAGQGLIFRLAHREAEAGRIPAVTVDKMDNLGSDVWFLLVSVSFLLSRNRYCSPSASVNPAGTVLSTLQSP